MENSLIRTFMTVDGITGSSNFHQEIGAIEILGLNHSFTQPSQPHRTPTTSGAVGKADHHDMTVRKQIDQSTRDLMKRCWQGKQIPTITISSYNAEVRFVRIVMEKVIITDLVVDIDEGGVSEQLSLNYAKVKYIYTPVDQNGTPQGEIPVEHDLETDRIS